MADDAGRIVDEPLSEALAKRYLAYALSTITSRALPDVRDGMKPVHRRILYAMALLRLDPASAPKKSARIVGDVMGRFHPHGDQAIYDALVRLAQDFTVRFPLVDGQGNFGNVDGDNAAAMRYTESRLTAAAGLLLDGIDEDAVDFRDTYDEQDREPVVLPAGFPNLLANGSAGIAVGMATSIPPHNVAELIDACFALIANPDLPIDELLALVPGPDFPTGGVMVEPRASIKEAYETGRGGFRLRARWQVEQLPRGLWRIIVTEVPYQVQKSKLVERLADLMETKKAPLLGDVRDESAEDIRLIIEPKVRTVEPAMLMESLFKLADLEVRVSLNMNVLDATGAPRVMGLAEVLRAFLDHQRDVVNRRANWRLARIEARLELLDGFLIAYLNLDEVIRIIRYEDEPKAELIKAFNLTDNQANAILDMQLRHLRKLEEMKIKGEHKALSAERKDLKALLGDVAKQWDKVATNLSKARELFAPETDLGRRRTDIADPPEPMDTSVEAFIAREPITIVLSDKGWIRALKGHVDDLSSVKFKDGDGPKLSLKAETTDRIILFATDGRSFALAPDKLPGGRGQGEPLRLLIDLGDDHDALALFIHKPGVKRLVASSTGYGFVVPEEELVALKKSGKQILTLDPKGRAAVCIPLDGDHVAVVGENRKLLAFAAEELPEMGRGKGVRLQLYKDGTLLDATSFNAAEGLVWIDAGARRRTLAEWRDWLGKRAGAGRMVPKGFPRTGKFSG
jgi:topoisomerase-4 subunit A